MAKTCVKCKIPKELEMFTNNKVTKDGKNIYCGSCTALKSKKWNVLNKEYKKEIDKKWEELNKERCFINRRNYRANNIEKNREYDKIWKRNKKQIDHNYKILDILRVRVNKAIKKGFKSKSTIELLGCPIDELKQYLEKQFKPEMNWLNHGLVWEIDHIIPCSSFDLTDLEQQKQCFHFNNLQPLFKTTNIAESFGYTNEIGNRNKSNIYGSF